MKRTISLRRQLLLALVAFLTALTVVITAFTNISNERAERFTWRTMLGFEMDRVERADGPQSSEAMAESQTTLYYRLDGGPQPPAAFLPLAEGVHDDIAVNGKLFAVMVRGAGPARRIMAIDVTRIEEKEHLLSQQVILTGIGLMLIFGVIAVMGLNRFLRPLGKLSSDIESLTPEGAQRSLSPQPGSTSELQTIANAVNGYAIRNERFIEREREFINAASHELRTPIAILRNNLELARTEAIQSPRTLSRLERIGDIVRDMESLLNVLLVLAKDPARLLHLYEEIDLLPLAAQIAREHAHLLERKELQVKVHGDDVRINGPRQIVTVAISNLIRNAIENSDRGTIDIHVTSPATLSVSDPGHGMSPQEISALYAQAARGPARSGQLGIGLQLLARICLHLEWKLSFDESSAHQTVAHLVFSRPKLG